MSELTFHHIRGAEQVAGLGRAWNHCDPLDLTASSLQISQSFRWGPVGLGRECAQRHVVDQTLAQRADGRVGHRGPLSWEGSWRSSFSRQVRQHCYGHVMHRLWNTNALRPILLFLCVMSASCSSYRAEAYDAAPHPGVSVLKISDISPNSVEDYRKNPPFTADEFWTKFIKLLRLQNGYITKNMFDAEFGVKINEINRMDEGISYKLSKGYQWYLEVNLQITNEKFKMPVGMGLSGALSILSIGWTDYPKTAPNQPDFGWCISPQTATEDIVASGWVIKAQQTNGMRPMYTEFYRPDKKSYLVIHIGFLPGAMCVFSVSVQAEP